MIFVFQVDTPTGQKRRLGYERKRVGDQTSKLEEQHQDEQDEEQAKEREQEDEEQEQLVRANGYFCDLDYPDYESYNEMDYESNCRLLFECKNEI